MRIYIRLLGYIKKYKVKIITSVFMSVLFSIFSAISVYLTIPLLKTLFLDNNTPINNQTPQTDVSGLYNNVQKFFEIFIFNNGKENA
ncbi:MAG: hypothetical protein NTU73_14110, partial [Ignavibacteriae bacterium]|nr:hypothetical protein [Ignavibacteriota bacterium]